LLGAPRFAFSRENFRKALPQRRSRPADSKALSAAQRSPRPIRRQGTRQRCVEAGPAHLSAQGVRKGPAEPGCGQYEMMAILGHSEAKTSEVYTRRVERWKRAVNAMQRSKAPQAWS
tara:strand:+ start:484 stop:834 length:351 start_codon:yes stop_codon:yes gene_type:complete